MRILIIEDEHKIARALKKALEQESYAVDVSYDGDDGYAMATTEPYDAMIVDQMLPGSHNGLDLSLIHIQMCIRDRDKTSDKSKHIQADSKSSQNRKRGEVKIS